jgi:hypothetical protein
MIKRTVRKENNLGLMIYLLLFSSAQCFSQSLETVHFNSGSVFENLRMNDSVVFYQCHVEAGTHQLSTASGQTISGTPKKYSITEKYVLTKHETGFEVKYSISSLNIFPNKKFTGLKFKEKGYWEFKYLKTFMLKDAELRPFTALEEKGRDAIVYDYGITKYTTNQLLIRYPNDYKQLVIDGPYVLSKLIAVNER